MPRLIALLLVAIATAAHPLEATAQDSLFGHPTEVTVVIQNTFDKFDGTYTSAQVSRLCGETDPAQFFTGEREFLAEFPSDLEPNARITDVTFYSHALVGATRESDSFFVSVHVITADGGEYPALVIDTERPAPGHIGKATLTVAGDTTTLRVQGHDDLGRSLDLNLVCRPAAP
jgi:hypothetical protein